MGMQLPVFLTHRATVRNLLYVLLFGLVLLSNAYIAKSNTFAFEPFEVSFALAFWLAVWFEHTVVLDRFLPQRQWGLALLGSAGSLLVFIGTRYAIEQEVYWYLFTMSNYNRDVSLIYYAWDNTYYGFPALFVGAGLKLIDDWLLHQQERADLVGQRNQAELAFLKSQVNPHFLFNTLNNIYALAYAKSDAAPGAILKLSELMRYMLYDSAGKPGSNAPERVPLSKEVAYLSNYVELEKLRVANAQVEFSVEGNTDLFRIEPLLLVSFVENAFKHGDLSDPGQPLVLYLSVQQGKLRFDTLNKKVSRQTDAVGGIGLANVRRRLHLLYPNRHTLHITDQDNLYACSLELTL